MKRLIPFLLVLAIFFPGCRMQPADNIQDTRPTQATLPASTDEIVSEPDATTSTTEEFIYEQKTMIAVSMPIAEELAADENGNIIFSHKHQNMQLVLHDPAVADSIILDFLTRLDAVYGTVEEICDDASRKYTGEDTWMPYFYDVLYSPARFDKSVMSLYGVTSSYTGSRPVQICSAANYNMLTGEVLTLGSILYHIDSKIQLINLVIQEADELALEYQLYDDYADYIAERFDREESFDEDWYFTDTGLCFYFSPYEIAPYSSGIIKIEVPYEKLAGIIADEFFPPEEDLLIGQINAQLFSEADLDGYTQIAEIIMDEQGESFMLFADGAVNDVQIEIGTWNHDGTIFTPSCTVFSTATLTPGDGIMVQTFIPDTSPSLRISYRSGLETIAVYLSQSGQDGSAILLEA